MRRRFQFQDGFSLVELLVALFFTMILMAGMASVFKSSLATFVTSGEKLSSNRRNRLAMDLLSDDLNVAGQYLTLDAAPNGITDANPGFVIHPNVAFTGTDVPAAVADELLFYFDDPLPAEGTFGADVLGTASYVASGAAATAGTGIPINFAGDPDVAAVAAAQVKTGMLLITRGNYEYKKILTADPKGATTTVTIDGMFGEKHLATEGVLIAKPAQYVRYRIQGRNFDPEKQADANGKIPCLIREQGPYPGAGTFAPDDALTTIVAENVTKFTVALSVDRGEHWRTGADWDAIKALLKTDLATSGAPGFTTISGNAHWYRSIPMLVRVNVTTRTLRSRSEYSATGTTSAYKEQTQSLVLLPRHFGLQF